MSDPFGTPWLVAVDSVRVLSGFVGLALVLGAITGALGKAAPRDERIAYTAVGMLAASVVGNAFRLLGDAVTWQVWTDALGVALAAMVIFRRGKPREPFPASGKRA